MCQKMFKTKNSENVPKSDLNGQHEIEAKHSHKFYNDRRSTTYLKMNQIYHIRIQMLAARRLYKVK